MPVSSGGTPLGAEQTFRRLDAPELLADIAEDVTYNNGLGSNHGQLDELLSQKAHLELSTYVRRELRVAIYAGSHTAI